MHSANQYNIFSCCTVHACTSCLICCCSLLMVSFALVSSASFPTSCCLNISFSLSLDWSCSCSSTTSFTGKRETTHHYICRYPREAPYMWTYLDALLENILKKPAVDGFLLLLSLDSMVLWKVGVLSVTYWCLRVVLSSLEAVHMYFYCIYFYNFWLYIYVFSKPRGCSLYFSEVRGC